MIVMHWLFKPHINIEFITGDRKGYPISKKRIATDMGYPLELVSTVKRIDWVKERYNPSDVIYMGDGIFDHYVMKEVAYAIAPANADPLAKSCAHYVCERSGGGRAVAEACLHVMEKIFRPYDSNRLPKDQASFGEWQI